MKELTSTHNGHLTWTHAASVHCC